MRPAPPKQPHPEDESSLQTEPSIVLDGQSTDATAEQKDRVVVLPHGRRRLVIGRVLLALVALALLTLAIRQVTRNAPGAAPGPLPGVGPTTTPTIPARPPFFFPIKAEAPATTGKARPAAARDASIEIGARLSTFYDTVFMDPATWTGGVPDDAWKVFDPSIVDRARADAEAFTMGGRAGGLATLSVTTSNLAVKVLLDPAGNPSTAVAEVDFVATGMTKDGQEVTVTNHVSFLLRPSRGLWVVFGYPSASTEVETAPVTPSPSGTATP
jgi:hypothetical protein